MKKPFALLWIFVGGILVFSWGYLPTLSKYRDLKMQQDDLDRQITKLTQDVEDVRQERDLLKNDVEYLEKVIRNEMGLVKPGEIVYKFVPDKQAEKTAKSTEEKSGKADETSKSAVSTAVNRASEKKAAGTQAVQVPAGGQVLEAKPVAAKTKPKAPAAAAVKAKTKSKTPAAAPASKSKAKANPKPKKTPPPPADQEPAYPRTETR